MNEVEMVHIEVEKVGRSQVIRFVKRIKYIQSIFYKAWNTVIST